MNTLASTNGNIKQDYRTGVPTNHYICENIAKPIIWAPKAEKSFQRLLSQVMERSGKGRVQIAAEMSLILGCPPERPIRKQTLDDCVRSRRTGRPFRFPAAWIPALCHVIGSDTLQRHLLSEQLREALFVGEGILESDKKVEALAVLSKSLRELRRSRNPKRPKR